MSRSRVLSGLAAACAALMLGACSGDEQPAGEPPAGTAAPSTAGPSTVASATGSAAPQAGSEFCTRSQELLEGLGTAFSDQADAASVRSAFEQAAEGFGGIEPPAAIEEDWTVLADALGEYAAAFAELDETDPESVAAFQERTGPLQGELTGAATSVESYLSAECGISDTAPSSAASS
jgi:hypothetical protein